MERLSDRFRIIAPDLYGHGHTAPWPGHRGMHIDDEADLLEPIFRLAGERFHLIGHSWGGAIALIAALRLLPRLLSVVLFEPALWSLLVSGDPMSAAARDITLNRDQTRRMIDEGDFAAAGEYFIDYWVGPGAWNLLTEARQSAFAAGMYAASPEWHASFNETTPLAAFSAMDAPTLLLTGTKSTIPAMAITALLSSVLPRAKTVHLDGVGHMGPVTHPESVNSVIEGFLLNSKGV
jgi:pimeloyl-ACP methyl ester carboxylesterase